MDEIPELIQWNAEAMTTGIASIDEQHRGLIAKINELHHVHQMGATPDDIRAVLKFLGEFTQKHFQHEEELMEAHKCPLRSENRLAHSRFLREYQELVANFSIEQDTDQTATEIERMVARWLSTHICRIDITLRDRPKE